MRKDSSILIFGGAGFIGFELANQLVHSGFTNVCIADLQNPNTDDESPVVFESCDILNELELARVFEARKPDVVCNHAGFAHLDSAVKHPKRAFELNVIGNINLLEASVQHNVELFVYASSAYAMSDKGSFYGLSKLSSEKVVQEYHRKFGINFSILRYGSIYAAVDSENNYLYNLVKTAIQEGVINHDGDGLEQREYVHVKDVSALSIQVIETSKLWNSALMLTGNERMTRLDVFEMIKEISGREIKINCRGEAHDNHYRLTPYSFQGMSAKKIIANPHYDMGQGILECIQLVNDVQWSDDNGEA